MIIKESDRILLVFGTGDIIMRDFQSIDDKGNIHPGIGFNQYVEGEVGRSPEKSEGDNLPYPVRFYFSNIESLDTVIKGFNIIRKQFLMEATNGN